mgnify:CR=1 FL=1
MTKLTRKLLLSIMTVAFAFITLGATTFAWFTLSTKADVEPFNVEVTSGAGIEISADGYNYSNYIVKEQIYAAITRAGSSTTLDHVTTTDGRNFRTLNSNEDFTKVAESGWTEFELFFRSPEKDVEVFMLRSTSLTSLGINWTSDADFQLTPTELLRTNNKKMLYAANAVRISTTEHDVSVDSGLNWGSELTTSNIFELNPTGTGTNQRLDTKAVRTYGAIHYYNQKNQSAQISDTTISRVNAITNESEPIRLPSLVQNHNNLPVLAELNTEAIADNTGYYPLTTLSQGFQLDGGANFYYGKITVRIWLEGWDPDMFNAIMADQITVTLSFGGHAPSSLLGVSGIDNTTMKLGMADLPLEPVATGIENYTGGFIFESGNEAVATVDAAGVVTAIGEGETTIKVSLADYPNVSKTIIVTVEPTPEILGLTDVTLTYDSEIPATTTINPTLLGYAGTFTYTSGDDLVVTVVDGVVTAIGAGETTITVSATDYPEIKKVINVTVNP